jgi:hypothetical protein
MADPSETLAQMVAQLLALQASVYDQVDRIYAWSTGAAAGGNGMFPIVTRSGDSVLVPSPAKIALGGLDKEAMVIACFADTALVSAGARIARERAVMPLHLTEVRASLGTASLAGNLTIDIKANGASILSTPITILANTITSKAPGTPAPVIATAAIVDDAEISVDVLGAGIGAKGLRVALIGVNAG